MTSSEIQSYTNRHTATVSPKYPVPHGSKSSNGNAPPSKISNRLNRMFRSEESKTLMDEHSSPVPHTESSLQKNSHFNTHSDHHSRATSNASSANSNYSQRVPDAHSIDSSRDSIETPHKQPSNHRQNISPSMPALRIPEDIAVASISENGLPMLLRSRLPLCYFLRFLLEEHSCENLICYLEIEHYQTQRYESAFEQQTAAHQILDVYLSPRSPFEVNVTERTHDQCQSAISSDDPEQVLGCFSDVKPAVYQLLLDAYTRFQRSDWWRKMASQLDGKRIYTQEDRSATVAHLIGYLQRLQQHDLVHAPERAALFRELIADFCRTVVGVEICMSRPTGHSSGTRGKTLPKVPNAMPPNYPHAHTHQSSQDNNSEKLMRKMKSNPLLKLKNGLRKLA